jgi:DNA modification methylase
MKLNCIYAMDCVIGMRKYTPDESIDLTVTSPPYDDLRKYKGYSFDFESVAKELYRVTKKGGVVVWVVGDKTSKGSESGTSFRQALFFMGLGFNLHDTMAYAKENYVPLTHNRYEQQFEYMFVFSKGKPKTFNPLLRPNKDAGKNKGGTFRHTGQELHQRNTDKETSAYSIRPNIWFYPVGKNNSTKDSIAFKHPAIFPEQLASDHIMSWSNAGDTVLDPFTGSGTVPKMAVLLGRSYVCFETSQEYVEDIAEVRVNAANGIVAQAAGGKDSHLS